LSFNDFINLNEEELLREQLTRLCKVLEKNRETYKDVDGKLPKDIVEEHKRLVAQFYDLMDRLKEILCGKRSNCYEIQP